MKAWLLLLEKNSEASQSLQNDKSTFTRNFAWSLDFATAVAVNAIRSSAKEIRTVLKGVVNGVLPPVAPERGIFPAFSELDAKIFGGRMKEAVYLKWSRLDDHTPGKTSTPGTVNPRITIELDEGLMYGSQSQLVLVLLHQMIHAYFLVCCSPRLTGSRDMRLGHDRHFCAIMYSVFDSCFNRQRQGSRRRWFQSSPTGRRTPKRQWATPRIDDTWQTYRQVRFGSSNIDQSCKNSSTCFEPFQCECPSDQIMQWYEDDCAKIDISRATTVYTLTDSGIDGTARTKAGLGSDFVEFVWDGKAFKIPRARVEANPSLKSRLSRQKNSRELHIPAVSQDTFRSLFTFIRTGAYPPELIQVQNHIRNESTFASTIGPPEILETRKDWPDFLATDIRAVKLAAELGLYEMESYGVRRLYAQHFTHNDPVAALEILYQDDWVPDRLRDWAVSFMAKPLSFRRAGQTEGFNVDLLQGSLSFSSGMTRLVGRSGALREDVQRAAAKIARSSYDQNGQMAMISPGPPHHLQQDLYPFAAESLARRNSISLPPHGWNGEPSMAPSIYPEPVDRRATLSAPLNPSRSLGHAYPSAHAVGNRSLHMFYESLEPQHAEMNGSWGHFY
ncbi:MAG: hypothetical protein M1821_000371 [Bathelium mastoideum]|nr:MAG: hypothetical protein M1821_000371 [Bathelium mastoideum]